MGERADQVMQERLKALEARENAVKDKEEAVKRQEEVIQGGGMPPILDMVRFLKSTPYLFRLKYFDPR